MLYSNETSGVQNVHGVLDLVMKKFGVIPHPEKGYSIKESQHPTFFEKQQVEILLCGKTVGHLGILHPESCKAYKIATPCSVLELNMEMIFDHFEKTS